MVTAALIILGIYLVIFLAMFLGLLFFPIWTLIECANSNRSKTHKTLWILAFLFFWSLASLLYGLTASRNVWSRRFSVSFVLLLIPGLLLALFNRGPLMSLIKQYPIKPIAGGVKSSEMDKAVEKQMGVLDCITVSLGSQKPEEDITKLTSAINLAPDSFSLALCYRLRAERYEKMGKADLAEKDLYQLHKLAQHQLEQNPKDTEAMIFLSQVFEKRKQYPEAIQYLENAIKTDPKKHELQQFRLDQLKKLPESNSPHK